MANTQIAIGENGTTTLATAGKYCDRNIDVNVDVVGKPTRFTNYYAPANVTCRTRIDCSAATGVQYNSDTQANMIVIPCYHKEGDPFVLRLRGISTVRDRAGLVIFAEDGETRLNHYQLSTSSYFSLSYDQHGDAVITFKDSILNFAWYVLKFNFQYPSYNSSPTEPLSGPIITINEPIGNGGYVQ